MMSESNLSKYVLMQGFNTNYKFCHYYIQQNKLNYVKLSPDTKKLG